MHKMMNNYTNLKHKYSEAENTESAEDGQMSRLKAQILSRIDFL